jgi:hypothetical protein
VRSGVLNGSSVANYAATRWGWSSWVCPGVSCHSTSRPSKQTSQQRSYPAMCSRCRCSSTVSDTVPAAQRWPPLGFRRRSRHTGKSPRQQAWFSSPSFLEWVRPDCLDSGSVYYRLGAAHGRPQLRVFAYPPDHWSKLSQPSVRLAHRPPTLRRPTTAWPEQSVSNLRALDSDRALNRAEG